jgi:polysaccharide pyruvyl transferase WcaK-like protein
LSHSVKILLGGVPFGRNNVGDEAILECIVAIVRKLAPDADITVSTDDQEATAEKLAVKTVQLFGFAPPYSRELMRQTIVEQDLFVWAGATGLSDYPEIPLEMLRIAHENGTATVVWGVGMNDELNPFLYKLMPGRRRSMLKLMSELTLGLVDFEKRREERIAKRVCDTMKEQLSKANLVVLRDPESQNAVECCRKVAGIQVGADSALILEPMPWSEVSLTERCQRVLEGESKKIGICISAQRELAHRDELIDFLDRLTLEERCHIVFLPMNPETDAELMAGLMSDMKTQEQALLVQGRREPAEVMAIAGKLDVVISSRLHLLILAASMHVPIIGISRGSKVDNFLAPFGLKSAGTVDECDFSHLQQEVHRLLEERAEFESISRTVRAELLQRLEDAEMLFSDVLNELRGRG